MFRMIFVYGLLLTILALASAPTVLAVSSDGSIFYDDFNDMSQLTLVNYGAAVGVAGEILNFNSNNGGYGGQLYNTNSFDYGTTDEWVVETRFRVYNGGPLTALTGNGWRETCLLVGMDAQLATTVDFALFIDSFGGLGGYNLSWGELATAMEPQILVADLQREQWYTVLAHHKPDNNVDIYLDNALVATKTSLTGAVKPAHLGFGEWSGDVVANFGMDYLSVGALATAPMTAVPAITPGTGTYSADQLVTITCATPGATIRYTTDGTTPTESSTVYTGSFTVSPGTTVSAIAWATGYVPSLEARVTYYQYMTSDGSIFHDDFNDLSKWSIEGDCTPGLSVSDSILRFDSTTGAYGWLYATTTDALNYGGIGEWVTEAKFRVIYGDPLHYYEPSNNLWRESGLLVGMNNRPYGWTADYALLLENGSDPTKFNLNWGDYCTSQPAPLATGLNKNQWYTVAMHHNVDNTVDIFLDGVCVASKPAVLFGQNSQAAYIGLLEGSGFTNAIYDLDYVSVGAPTLGGPKVAAPSITPGAGTYYLPQMVTIACSTPGATIRYTTDGTNPTESSTAYTGSFMVNPGTTVSAKAWADGYEPSVIVRVVYGQPSFDRPQYVKYSNSVVIDGNLSDWSDADWVLLDQVYAGDPEDIDPGSEYAVKWGENGNRVYVAVRVLDTDHFFTDTYTNWNARDAVEIYLHTTGSSPDRSYNLSEAAQEYAVGLNSTATSFWTQLGYKLTAPHENPVPTEANFQAAATRDGAYLYYEAAMTPFEYFGAFAGQPNVVSTLEAGQVIGVDAVAVGHNATAFTGMRSENTKTNKSGDYSMFGQHLLLPAVAPMAQAKESADGAWVSVNGTVTAVFDGYFYVESNDRSSGIRVEKPGYTVTVGNAAFVSGVIGTAPTGERYIAAVTVNASAGTALQPLGMTNKALGGGATDGQEGVFGASGLNNIGLLVRTTGKVSNLNGRTFNLNDGSGVALTVVVPDGQPLPANDAYISVTGISSCTKVAGNIERWLLVTSWN